MTSPFSRSRMISSVALFLALAVAGADAAAVADADPAALPNPVDKSQLRTSPKSPQASPTGVYFDAATGTFRQHAAVAGAAKEDSPRAGRRKQDLSRDLNDICRPLSGSFQI